MGTIKCRYCGAQFSAKLLRCPECGTRVRKRHVHAHREELQLRLVAMALSMPEKDIICSILETEGIHTLLQFPDGSGVSALTGEPAGRIGIYVAKDDYEKAVQLLEELKNAPPEDSPERE